MKPHKWDLHQHDTTGSDVVKCRDCGAMRLHPRGIAPNANIGMVEHCAQPLRELDLKVADHVMHIIHYRPNDTTRAIIKDENGSRYAMAEYKTMDEKHLKPIRCPECGTSLPSGWERGKGNRWFTSNLPHYSTNLADAWKVVEQLKKESVYLTLSSVGEGYQWHARLFKEGVGQADAYALTPEEAICRAALEILEQ